MAKDNDLQPLKEVIIEWNCQQNQATKDTTAEFEECSLRVSRTNCDMKGDIGK